MSLWNRFRNTLQPARVDSDVNREFETHLAELQDDLMPSRVIGLQKAQYRAPRT